MKVSDTLEFYRVYVKWSTLYDTSWHIIFYLGGGGMKGNSRKLLKVTVSRGNLLSKIDHKYLSQIYKCNIRFCILKLFYRLIKLLTKFIQKIIIITFTMLCWNNETNFNLKNSKIIGWFFRIFSLVFEKNTQFWKIVSLWVL